MTVGKVDDAPNSFETLWNFVKSNFRAPIGQVSFWVALVFGVVLFGGLGVWFELGKHLLLPTPEDDLGNLRTAIHTFFPAIAVTATMQLVMSNSSAKEVRSAGYALGVFLVFSAVGLLLLDKVVSPKASLIWGTIASFVSVLIWWIASGKEEIFYDHLNLQASVGGDVNAELSGTLDGIKH